MWETGRNRNPPQRTHIYTHVNLTCIYTCIGRLKHIQKRMSLYIQTTTHMCRCIITHMHRPIRIYILTHLHTCSGGIYTLLHTCICIKNKNHVNGLFGGLLRGALLAAGARFPRGTLRTATVLALRGCVARLLPVCLAGCVPRCRSANLKTSKTKATIKRQSQQ